MQDSSETVSDEEALPEEPIADLEEVVEEAEGEAPEVEEKELTPDEEILQWKEAALRASADLDNFRKRMAREKTDAIRYACQGLLEDLLPVIDNFEMGMMAAEQDQESMIYQGMSMVQKQLTDFLSSQGVQEVVTSGEFDPNEHEAVAQEDSEENAPGTILRVHRKGYRLNDRLLRAAAVVVAKGEEESQEEEG